MLEPETSPRSPEPMAGPSRRIISPQHVVLHAAVNEPDSSRVNARAAVASAANEPGPSGVNNNNIAAAGSAAADAAVTEAVVEAIIADLSNILTRIRVRHDLHAAYMRTVLHHYLGKIEFKSITIIF